MNYNPQYLLNLLMNFNQICQAGSSLSYKFTEVVTWLEDKYLNTAPNCRKPVQSLIHFKRKKPVSKYILDTVYNHIQAALECI